MDLNLHLVRYLVTVVDEGHFGRAAARLFISGPALSKQVRALEQKLGAELIDRSAHPVLPTEAGRRFLPEARAALAAADRAVAAVDAHRRALSGALRLGFMTTATGTHTRRVLDVLHHDMPGSAVQLVQLGWPEQAAAVRAGAVDASLVRPPVANLDGLQLDVLRNERRVVALPAGHHLAATRTAVALDDLDHETHVFDDETDGQWVRWWACDPRPSGVPVRYGPTVHTLDELLEVVASGAAIAITGGSVADSYRHPEVAFLPLTDAEPCPISLCTRVDDPSPLVAGLRRAVHAVREDNIGEASPRRVDASAT